MGYNMAKRNMKKYIFLTVFMAFGMLISTAYARSNSKESSSEQKQELKLTVNCGDIYRVTVYELKQGSGSVTIKKSISAQFDDETYEIIIDGDRYSWSRNPYYGKSGYGKVADYKYVVAGKYYFNWEYQGDGRFRDNF